MERDKLEAFFAEYPDWYQEEDELVAGFEFADFEGVKNLLSSLTSVIDEQNHHPTVTFGYNTIEIRTTTHDAGGAITEKDLELAKKVSALL